LIFFVEEDEEIEDVVMWKKVLLLVITEKNLERTNKNYKDSISANPHGKYEPPLPFEEQYTHEPLLPFELQDRVRCFFFNTESTSYGRF
jgi:hypothetical protein